MNPMPHLPTRTVLCMIAVTLLAGCVNSRSGRNALACPDCRTIVKRDNPRYENYGYGFPEESVRHECPGCQGALTTLFTEGRLAHQCSRCEGTPYSCAVH